LSLIFLKTWHWVFQQYHCWKIHDLIVTNNSVLNFDNGNSTWEWIKYPKFKEIQIWPHIIEFPWFKRIYCCPMCRYHCHFFTTVFVSGFVRRHFPFVWEKEYFVWDFLTGLYGPVRKKMTFPGGFFSLWILYFFRSGTWVYLGSAREKPLIFSLWNHSHLDFYNSLANFFGSQNRVPKTNFTIEHTV